MGCSFEEAAASASILGTLFYFDPKDERCASLISSLCSPDAAPQWPSANEADTKALRIMRENTSSQSESLHESFSRLLIGPAKLPAPPWGSVYTDRESVIFGNKTLDVRSWMRENGVKIHLKNREPEDHFGLLLIMFSWGVGNGVSEEALRELLEFHVLPWAPRFLELFTEGARGTFYEGLGRLALSTLDKWTETFDLKPQSCRLYR